MNIVRPRLNDFHDLSFTQEMTDFAIPFIEEDLPLYLDPFLLWKSPSMQDNSLHTALIESFNYIGQMYINAQEQEAILLLKQISECEEVGLGLARNKQGHRISDNIATSILTLFKNIPQINKSGFSHIEIIQLLIDNISKDRISDITCNLIKSFLIDFTIEQSKKLSIPMEKVEKINVFDFKIKKLVEETNISMPVNPNTKKPIILVPKRWLKFIPWINYEDYYTDYFIANIEELKKFSNKIAILNYNRENYDVVKTFVDIKERTAKDCKNDPLFSQIPVHSSKTKLIEVLKLPTGKTEKADLRYEDLITQLMASFLYPDLDFAKSQSRTDSGVLIRDIIFYSNRNIDFLKDIYKDYGVRQIVFELKNVKELNSEHINQLNRYMTDQFGKFSIIITRNNPTKAIKRNLIDLWSGQRKCILIITDEELKLMSTIYEDKQRKPIDVIKKIFIEFLRTCPS